ncbi:MAG: phage tail tape measure protein [Methylobacter sp.]
MNALNTLLFRVSLLDGMSGPARTMMNNMDRVTSRIQGGFNKIAYGAGGLAGAAYSLDSILQPAKDVNAALGEISSMSVAQDVLDNLNKTALKFSVQFGESAAEFVSSAYDIQGAISGLVGNELPAFTYASDVLAKGTKADMATITNYVGTMYGIFHDKADAMGKANWINRMASQTAVAVNIFKSTGQGMSDAFENLGARAATANIAMEEQMAILGSLQATMKGAEAGTGYRSFLDKVVKSQKDLNLSFLDGQNHMLPMVDILTKIKGKYGDLSDQKQMAIVSKAFGESPEAMRVITALIGNIDGLSASIAQVGEQTGLQGAIDMAKAMTMPWEQAEKAVDAVRIMLGQKMLPVMTPVYNGITGISEKLMRWMDLFPHITTYIGYAVFGVLGIIAALSALSIMVGVGMVTMIGFGAAVAFITSPITWAVAGIIALGAAVVSGIAKWDEWGGAIMYVGRAITDAFGITGLLQYIWNLLTQIYTGWSMIFNVIYTNAGGILSFIGDVVVAVGQIIDILGRALGFGPVLDWVEKLFNMIVTGWKLIAQMTLPDWLQKLIPGLSANVDVTQTAVNQPRPVTQSPALAKLDAPAVIAQPDTVAQSPALAKLTTPAAIAQPSPAIQHPPVLVNLNTPAAIAQPSPVAQPPVQVKLDTPAAIAQPQTAAPSLAVMAAQPQPIAPPAALSQSQTANVPKGGIMSQINNANNSKSVSVGGITVNNYGQPVTGQRLADEIAMAVG